MTGGWFAGFAVNLAFAGVVVALWGLAYGAYFWPDLRRWWRSRREPADTRMMRAHAEWVRRAKVVRPPLPRRPAILRPTVTRVTSLPVRALPTPPASPPDNIIPFPRRP